MNSENKEPNEICIRTLYSKSSFMMWLLSTLDDFKYASGFDIRYTSMSLSKSDLRNISLCSDDRPFVITFDMVHGTTSIVNTKTGRSGFSKCGHSKFSYLIGTAVAWHRYCKKDVPYFVDEAVVSIR